jgi:hypothetical protein
MPESGQVALQVGVAVKVCELVAATVAVGGLTETELRVTVTVTVITAEASWVDAPSVALTKMPPVTAVVPAVKVPEAPVPLTEPSVALVTVQV